jgi:hypothetical protein
MLLALASELPTGPGVIFEPKIDGMRAVVTINSGKVRAMSRHGVDWTPSFPELADLGEEARDAVLDGELAVPWFGHPHGVVAGPGQQDQGRSQSFVTKYRQMWREYGESRGTQDQTFNALFLALYRFYVLPVSANLSTDEIHSSVAPKCLSTVVAMSYQSSSGIRAEQRSEISSTAAWASCVHAESSNQQTSDGMPANRLGVTTIMRIGKRR